MIAHKLNQIMKAKKRPITQTELAKISAYSVVNFVNKNNGLEGGLNPFSRNGQIGEFFEIT